MHRYALTFTDSLNCLGVFELWEPTHGDAMAKADFLAHRSKWLWFQLQEIPQA